MLAPHLFLQTVSCFLEQFHYLPDEFILCKRAGCTTTPKYTGSVRIWTPSVNMASLVPSEIRNSSVEAFEGRSPLLPRARITGVHRHTPFMGCWGSTASLVYARQAFYQLNHTPARPLFSVFLNTCEEIESKVACPLARRQGHC